MIGEIGSEFWKKYDISDEKCDNEIIVLSGRTALDFIIRDLKISKSFNSIMLPSYCCDSMIDPFIRNNIKVSFYCVRQDGIEYPINDADAVLLLDYFGYVDNQITDISHQAKFNGQTVIYDGTHYLGKREIDADYSFCSYRKWFFCNYATVTKQNGQWNVPYPVLTNEKYVTFRNKAAELKRQYIDKGNCEKKLFLDMFSDAEELLEKDYLNYYGEKVVCDEVYIAEKRRINARRLVDGICKIKEIKIWREQIRDNDIPLFVPILVAENQRDELRKYLIDHEIYCPVHWPLSNLHGNINEIFNNELSLVCDQRYSLEEIDKEIEVVKNFFEGRTD